jgi:hypothetical protein
LKDDKKKLAIVGVLGFIVVGVGAFQFMHGSAPAPVKKPAPKQALVADAKDKATSPNPAYAAPLPARDPFKAPADSGMPDDQTKQPPTTSPSKGVSQPPHMRGSVGGSGYTLPPGAGTVAPLAVAAPPVGYRLSGLINGQHPAAVFTDATGAQRLVPLSGSLDGDTQLIAVQKGRAVVSFRGKHLRLSLGGTPDAN